MSRNSSKNDLLKLIAIISMIIDHIGYVFYPGIVEFRIIGRIAFPIFAYQIALGYCHTRDLKKYKFRLLIFAMVSQIPYILVFPTGLNIFFNLLLAVYAIEFYDKNRFFGLGGLLIYTYLVGKVILFGYGIYGILLSLIFYIYSKKPIQLSLSFLLLTFSYWLYYNNFIQTYALLALPIILINWKYKVILNKWWFYLFYPTHLIILYFIQKIIIR